MGSEWGSAGVCSGAEFVSGECGGAGEYLSVTVECGAGASTGDGIGAGVQLRVVLVVVSLVGCSPVVCAPRWAVEGCLREWHEMGREGYACETLRGWTQVHESRGDRHGE